MNRVYNFSAGPSSLPLPVLERAGREISCYGSSGMSVMEMSHRAKDFVAIAEAAEGKLRCIMGIPDNYKVLFLQGGASMQFAAVPLNLLPEGGSADYVDSGNFAHLAMEEAKRFGNIRCAASSRDVNYINIPDLQGKIDDSAAYVHITGNNTIYGTRYTKWPEIGATPLVCDLSSSILSEPIDVSKFGLIYAGAQKNMAPAGLTVVIIREDLIGRARTGCPAMLDYAVQAKAGSMYNTPPTWCIYMLGLVLEWIEGLGGLAA
ncbi:MAG: 3-phosphoserine/phosphohydroxythreonine transaminase, partial [Clostridia bacterium]|nr:3-phosphoserine/phosphohydroxythreonine transaminase [Clostridia bacterium]